MPERLILGRAEGRRPTAPAFSRGRRAESPRTGSRRADRLAAGADPGATAGAGAATGAGSAGTADAADAYDAGNDSTVAFDGALGTDAADARDAGASPFSGTAATLPELINGTVAPHKTPTAMAVARRAPLAER